MRKDVDLSAVLSSIESHSSRLNTVSNNGNAVLRKIEGRLTAANIGLEVWWSQNYLDHMGSVDLRRDETECCYRQILGFAPIDRQWCLAVRTMRCSTVLVDGEELDREAIAVGATPLLRAPRNVRLAALRLMPDFLEYLAKEIETAVAGLEKATASLVPAAK